MSDETTKRVAEIRERWAAVSPPPPWWAAPEDVAFLLAEIDRLNERIEDTAHALLIAEDEARQLADRDRKGKRVTGWEVGDEIAADIARCRAILLGEPDANAPPPEAEKALR